MSEEYEISEDVIVEDEILPPVEEVVEEFSDSEVEAMSKGWSSEGIEGKRNLTADEFLDRQPLYDKIHKTDRAMKRLEEQNKAITSHLEMIRRSSMEDKMDNLKSQKREALEEQDHSRVMEIDEQIIEVSKSEPISVEAVQSNDVFDSWLETNEWYGNSDKMREFADRYGAGILAQNPEMNLKDVYTDVAEEVKERFSDHFKPSRSKASPVEGSRPRSKPRSSDKHTVKDLDSDAKVIHDNLIRANVMTSEEYIADLEQTGYFL